MMRVAAIVLLGVMLAGCSDDNYHASAGHGPSTAARPPTAAPVSPGSPGLPGLPSPMPSRTPRTKPTTPTIARVTAAKLGASWHAGCPIGPSGLRMVTVRYRGFDGRAHSGRLVVAADLAGQVRSIFAEIYASGFPIRRMVPVAAYGGDDERSMEADNTSAFNCRPITGGGGWSQHAYGRAIDIDPLQNPYVAPSGIEPVTARRYLDRSQRLPGMLHAGDPVVRIFTAHGWTWGGRWSSPTDYQHFQRS